MSDNKAKTALEKIRKTIDEIYEYRLGNKVRPDRRMMDEILEEIDSIISEGLDEE